MTEVHLTYGVDGKRIVRLRPLTGADERAAGADAHALLKQLAVPGEGRVADTDIDRIPLCDRDQALAVLYRVLYGDTVTADARCSACKARFELRFAMSQLSASRIPDTSGENASIVFGEVDMRLPTAADLSAVGHRAPSALLSRLCPAVLTDDWTEARIESVSEALDKANPVLDLDLEGACPECNADNRVRFSIVEFMNAALSNEAGFLSRELHLLASAYGWSYESLVALPRTERREFVRLVLADRQGSAQMRRIA